MLAGLLAIAAPVRMTHGCGRSHRKEVEPGNETLGVMAILAGLRGRTALLGRRAIDNMATALQEVEAGTGSLGLSDRVAGLRGRMVLEGPWASVVLATALVKVGPGMTVLGLNAGMAGPLGGRSPGTGPKAMHLQTTALVIRVGPGTAVAAGCGERAGPRAVAPTIWARGPT